MITALILHLGIPSRLTISSMLIVYVFSYWALIAFGREYRLFEDEEISKRPQQTQ
jgi:hypothetical protein